MSENLTPAEIRSARRDRPKLRDRDLSDALGISEAQLVAAHVGYGATPIAAHPDRLMPALAGLGDIMALTRNKHVVAERVGHYDAYQSGDHACMILGPEIDMRIFPRHWVHGFAVTRQTDAGTRRSLQVFDASGDAIHKMFARGDTDIDAWDAMVESLAMGDAVDMLDVVARAPTEAAKADPAKRDILLREWDRLTDTHQFLVLMRKMKMNRLGAYRLAGPPYARLLAPEAVATMLETVAKHGVQVMIFVGNQGCIQIHGGRIDTLKPMGPWLNVMDPRFNLHLRGDRIAEVYAVTKPTKRGPALSIEAFDAEGGLISQVFPLRKDDVDNHPAFAAIVDTLPVVAVPEVAR